MFSTVTKFLDAQYKDKIVFVFGNTSDEEQMKKVVNNTSNCKQLIVRDNLKRTLDLNNMPTFDIAILVDNKETLENKLDSDNKIIRDYILSKHIPLENSYFM